MWESTGQAEREPKEPRKEYDDKTLGHKGGLKEGKARTEKPPLERRSEIAKKAAQARWKTITW